MSGNGEMVSGGKAHVRARNGQLTGSSSNVGIAVGMLDGVSESQVTLITNDVSSQKSSA